MRRAVDRRWALTELEAAEEDEPNRATGLVRTCDHLRRKPVGQLTAGDLRLLIGQGIGVRFLIPLALEVLRDDPLVEVDYFPGDLLKNVIEVDADFWQREWEWRDELDAILARLPSLPTELHAALDSYRRGRRRAHP